VSPPTVPLACPACGRSFNYEYLPGVSVSAVRLGGRRYMRCPLCDKFGLFDLRSPRIAGTPPSPQATTYSDRRHALRWIAIFLAPGMVVVFALGILLPRPEPALWAVLLAGAIIVVGTIVLVYRATLPPRAPGS
jgi:hypothetical protein